MNSVTVFDEPQLEFASGEMLEHPRDGLTLFGPVDSKGIEKPSHLCYGVVGTKSGVGAFREFVKAVNRPIPTDSDLDEVLWPHFPGFEEAFHAVLPTEPAWVEELDELVVKNAASNLDDHLRVFGVVSLFLSQIRAAKKSDEPVVLCHAFKAATVITSGSGSSKSAHRWKTSSSLTKRSNTPTRLTFAGKSRHA